MTGYGLAFPHNSKHRARFNDMLLEYKVELDTKVRSCELVVGAFSVIVKSSRTFVSSSSTRRTGTWSG